VALAEAPAPDGTSSAVKSSEDVRLALRVLSRALAGSDAPLSTRPSVGGPAADPVLVVGPDARWFRVGDREPVSLRKARSARLILAALARQRLGSPAAALPIEALFEAGWPGERIAPKAAANRVYVTVTKLRNLGLRGLLLSRDDGFLVDPAAAVLEALGEGEGRG